MRAEKFTACDVGIAGDRSVAVEIKINDAGQMEVERLFALDQPSLEALSFILRHRELWPEGFEWSYSNCSTCAMGLAATLWKLWDVRRTFTDRAALMMSAIFDLPLPITAMIFEGQCVKEAYGALYDEVTPEMVADQIDKYLAEVHR